MRQPLASGSVTGNPFRFMGNVRNEGYITNLPDGCRVEVPLDPALAINKRFGDLLERKTRDD